MADKVSAAGQKVFDRFDADKSGVLDLDEVKEALKIMVGTEVPQNRFDKAMAKFDKDNSGQIDILEFQELYDDIKASSKMYVEPPLVLHEGSILGKNKKLPYQDTTLKLYSHKFVVTFVACCIMGNFFVNMLEKQIDPDINNMKYEVLWANLDITFNVIFLFELIANMWSYGGPVRRFWQSGWNVFDTIIVTVGVLSMLGILGPPLNKIKLMRAFRVFRLFKRVESLNKIIVALLNSIPGVSNAFVVMVVFFCIYAILAVELFREFGEGGHYTTTNSLTGHNVTIDSVSARGFVHGIEYYGTFMRAIYTLFQVMTGESWSEAVARPLLFGLYQNDAFVVGFFFVSFIILTQLVLINVVVAVLLENFVSNEDDSIENASVESRLEAIDRKEASMNVESKLDRILCDLSKLNTMEKSISDLQVKMEKVDALTISVAELRADMCAVREERIPIGW